MAFCLLDNETTGKHEIVLMLIRCNTMLVIQWNLFIGTTVGTEGSGPIRGVKIPLEYVDRDSGGWSVGRSGPIKGWSGSEVPLYKILETLDEKTQF